MNSTSLPACSSQDLTEGVLESFVGVAGNQLDLFQTSLFELVDLYTGELMLAYGVGDGYFVLGSSAETIESLFEGGASLADNERYEEVWKAFPRDMRPVLYFDIQGLIANIRETIPAAALEDFEEELGQGLP